MCIQELREGQMTYNTEDQQCGAADSMHLCSFLLFSVSPGYAYSDTFSPLSNTMDDIKVLLCVVKVS